MGRRLAALGTALWAGVLLAVAGLATPAPFALLPPADAGRVAARILAQEAWLSLGLATATAVLLRRGGRPGDHGSRSAERRLLAGTVALTLLGYFLVQALLPTARAGQGMFSFAQLHLFSTLCFGLKAALVLALAWRLGAPPRVPAPSS